MLPITFPLNSDNQRSDGANLDQGLRLLLRNQIIQPPEQLSQSIEERLRDEEQAQVYSVTDVVLPEINQKLNTINAHAENLNSINSKLDVLSTLREPVVSLRLSDRGSPVQNLQANLSQLNFVIPQNELNEQVFGVGTRDALLQLQTKYQLSPTGIFDDNTKIAIERAIADFTISTQRISFLPTNITLCEKAVV